MIIETEKELADIRKIHKDKIIVSTNGCFDLFHPGHVHCLEEAKKLGNILVVGINSDDSVRTLKGIGKPLNSEKYRVMQVNALRCVDYVYVFDNVKPNNFLEILKPNVHVKGGDYTPDSLKEKNIVENNGGIIKIIPTLKPNITVEKVKYYT